MGENRVDRMVTSILNEFERQEAVMSRGTRLSRWLLGMSLMLLGGARVEAATWADGLFTETGIDFGTVPRGSLKLHNFVFKNTFGEPLKILDVRASCGCTSGKAFVDQVAPGETAIIEAQMDTKQVWGRKSTILYVSLATDSGAKAEASLNVTAMILTDVVLNPGTVEFGTVVRGQSPAIEIAIDRVSVPDWRITRMITACKVIDASCTEVARNNQMVSYRLKVWLKPAITSGIVRDEIRLVTNDKESPIYSIPITAMIRGDLTASPSMISLGNVDKSLGARGKYIVRASRPFKIRSILGDGDGFQLTADNDESRPVHLLSLNYQPAQGVSRGDIRRSFRVTTDLRDEVPLELSAALHVDP